MKIINGVFSDGDKSNGIESDQRRDSSKILGQEGPLVENHVPWENDSEVEISMYTVYCGALLESTSLEECKKQD